ncbi:MAG: C45 family autoproteolytic acyltransferase/hydrolase [Promethearchaeota archaeon]
MSKTESTRYPRKSHTTGQSSLMPSWILKWKTKSFWNKCGSIGITVLLLGTLVYSTIRIGSIEQVEGEAKWITTNGQSYLQVSASDPYDAGYVIGQQLASQILTLKIILMALATQSDTSYTIIKEMANAYLPYIPEPYLDEMRGMAKGATNKLGIVLTFQDILVQNTWMDSFYGHILPSQIVQGPVGCTAIAVKNNDSSIVIGQNFDFTQIFDRTLSYVHQILPTGHEIFGLRLGGSLNLPMGRTSNNLTVLTTLVQTNLELNFSTPVTIRSRMAMESARNVDEFWELYRCEDVTPFSSIGHTLLIANSTSLMGVSIVGSNTHISFSDQIVYTNTFQQENWQTWLVNQTYSKDRQLEAIQQVNAATLDGYLSEEDLLDILYSSPIIFRQSSELMASITLAFMTPHYFGLGVQSKEASLWGQTPI